MSDIPLSGFSLVKNATIQDYPVEVAVRSALAVCRELVVNVGASEDDTLERVEAIDDPRLRIVHRKWPGEIGSRLRELSGETNRAMDRCHHEWALYLQADEVLHEDDRPALRDALARAKEDPRVEGLLFDYLHFHGSPDWVLTGRRRYRREVRVVRRGSGVRSARDAQGFRVGERKPRVIRSGARIFHYGYVKSREGLIQKRRLWLRQFGQPEAGAEDFRLRRPRGLRRFTGSHPAVARPWIEGRTWDFDPGEAEAPPLDLNAIRIRVSDAVERLTGHRLFEHRNYRLLD